MVARFKKWMQGAGELGKYTVAKSAGLSVTHLYNIASGNRKASAESAANIEGALSRLGHPGIDRTDICKICAECPFAIKCKKEEAKNEKI